METGIETLGIAVPNYSYPIWKVFFEKKLEPQSKIYFESDSCRIESTDFSAY